MKMGAQLILLKVMVLKSITLFEIHHIIWNSNWSLAGIAYLALSIKLKNVKNSGFFPSQNKMGAQ